MDLISAFKTRGYVSLRVTWHSFCFWPERHDLVRRGAFILSCRVENKAAILCQLSSQRTKPSAGWRKTTENREYQNSRLCTTEPVFFLVSRDISSKYWMYCLLIWLFSIYFVKHFVKLLDELTQSWVQTFVVPRRWISPTISYSDDPQNKKLILYFHAKHGCFNIYSSTAQEGLLSQDGYKILFCFHVGWPWSFFHYQLKIQYFFRHSDISTDIFIF